MNINVPKLPPWANTILTVLAILLAGGALTVSASLDNGPDGPAGVTITVNDQGAGASVPDKQVEAPAALVNQAAGTIHQKLRDEAPAIAPPAQIEQAKRANQRNVRTTDPLPIAGASRGFKGCLTRFVRNQSSRNGVRPTQFRLHYTVSANRPGWSDVNAIVALFDRSSFQASSNFVIDAEGHCAYIVPIEAKAWTQAAANPSSISVEVINTGSESAFMASAGYARLRSVALQVKARTGIPVGRRGGKGCGGFPSGTVDHFDGGLCAGGHHDIHDFSVEAVIRIIAGPVEQPISRRQRVRCQELNRLRVKARPPGPQWTEQDKKHAARYRAGFRRYKLRCVAPRGSRPGRLVRR